MTFPRDCRTRIPLWQLSMIDLSHLKIGMKGSADLLVGPEHTAPRIGSGRVPVLATPVMINLIEAAALAAVEHLLPDGHQVSASISMSAISPPRRSECASTRRPNWSGSMAARSYFRSRPTTRRSRSGTARTSASSSMSRASTSASRRSWAPEQSLVDDVLRQSAQPCAFARRQPRRLFLAACYLSTPDRARGGDLHRARNSRRLRPAAARGHGAT